MLIVGIIGQQSKVQTANLISLILNSTGKKVSIIDSKSFIGLNSCLIKSYLNELKKNNTDILILKIAAANIKKELFYDIHFDIIIYTEKADDLREEDVYKRQGIVFCRQQINVSSKTVSPTLEVVTLAFELKP